MTEKRFHFGYVCGDTGLIDEQAELKWFIENVCNINDLKKNWLTVCDKLNEVADENEKLKKVMNELKDMLQRDIDTGVRSYPLKLSEYLVSALEKIGDSE